MTVCPPSANFSSIRPRPSVIPGIVSVAPTRSRLLPKISGELSVRSPIGLRSQLPNVSRWRSGSVLQGKRCSSVCYVSGNNNADKADKPSSWNPFEKGVGVEDILRQQMQKKEYADGGSGGGGGLFGGGNDGRGDSGDSEGDDLQEMMHEFWQVILATVGFIFLYMLIIDGEEITRMGKDILKFIFTRKKSIRLTRTLDNWGNFFKRLGVKERKDPYWLERAILRTPTWWDGPSKYRRNPRERLAPRYESY